MDDSVRQILLKIYRRHKGHITPEHVVEEASDERSPLHDLFEWDDAAAAHQHRLDLAREVIRSVRVSVTVNNYEVACPIFVRDPASAPHQGYALLSEVRGDQERARLVIADEAGRARAALARALAVASALNLEGEIDRLINNVTDLRERALRGKPPRKKPLGKAA